MSLLRKIFDALRGRKPQQIPTPTGWNPEAGGIPPHVPGAGSNLPPLPPKPERLPTDEI
jgi:hypothetical protein